MNLAIGDLKKVVNAHLQPYSPAWTQARSAIQTIETQFLDLKVAHDEAAREVYRLQQELSAQRADLTDVKNDLARQRELNGTLQEAISALCKVHSGDATANQVVQVLLDAVKRLGKKG